MTTNRTVIDLNKVQHATFGYKNQYGHYQELKPKNTFRGQTINPNTRLTPILKSKLDIWTPFLSLQLTANHCIAYTGNKAVSIWKEWNRRIFKKNNK
jgi:hypothetical protein